jgi:hypothetical protein
MIGSGMPKAFQKHKDTEIVSPAAIGASDATNRVPP